jgi:hypothetical protein
MLRLLLAAVALAGCGSSGSPTASATNAKYTDALAFSQCMRAAGVPNFPDPTTGGGLTIRGGPGTGLDPTSPAFQSAQHACQSKLPNGGQPQPLSASRRSAMLHFSQCMRSHGLTNFPDPTFSGGGVRIALARGSGLDPNSPAFKAAQQDCGKLLPKLLGAP